MSNKALVNFSAKTTVVCGGCTNGFIKKRNAEGNKTSELIPHPDCKGTGRRVNKKYGNCGA